MNKNMSSEKALIQAFFKQIRSGKALDQVEQYMHNPVIAHQVQSENAYSVKRSPQQYAEHVLEMIDQYGTFILEIEEILADANKVYVRWKQTAKDIQENEIIEIASAVYLIQDNKIAEYWIQIDRKGLELQLEN